MTVAVYEEHKRNAVCTFCILRLILTKFGTVRDPQAVLLSFGEFLENLCGEGRKYWSYVKLHLREYSETLWHFSCKERHAKVFKYMVMSRDQNAGRSRNIKIDNSSFERVEDFRYLGTALTNQNSIQEEIKSR